MFDMKTVEEKASEYAPISDCMFAVTEAFIAGYTMRDGESQWVSVETELPKEGVKVLVLGEQSGMNPNMGGAYVSISKRIWLPKVKWPMLRQHVDENGFAMMQYVTQWQNLPQPPKNDLL